MPSSVTPGQARPIQPSISIQLAEYLALTDPRCSDDRHGWTVVGGMSCPACSFTRRDYLGIVPAYWPELVTA